MSTTTVEFHWAGTDGTCRNLGKFGLIADKVVFTFNYDTIAYVQGLMKSFTLNGSILELTAPQEQELIAFSIENSRVDPFVTEAGEYAAQAKESARRAAESQMFAALSQDHADQSAITAVTSAATAVNAAQSARTSADAVGKIIEYVEGNWYHPPVAYVAGLVVTDGKFTVALNDRVFFANPEFVPFTTGQIFDEQNWLVFSNVSREELSPSAFDRIDIKSFGAKGDYVTDDSAAIQAALDWCGLNGKSLYVSRGVYRHTRSFDVPANINIFGVGAPKIAHFPQYGGDKDLFRQGMKHLISGSSFIFSGTATKTYTTNRSDRYASFTYVWGVREYAGFSFKDVGLLLDCDIRTPDGALTTGATDNKAIAGSLLVVNGTLGSLQGVTIFGYTSNAAYVVHNQIGDLTYDCDYIDVSGNTLISGSVAIIGHDRAAGPSTEGLTGNRFVGAGIYGGDHHWRADGDYTRPVVFVDGYMGDNPQSGIRGHSFVGCNLRGYANDAIVLEHCNDLAFVGNTYEFSSIVGVANADKEGRFVGSQNTKRIRLLAGAATGSMGIDAFAKAVFGPIQIIGHGEFDTAVFGTEGQFVRVNAASAGGFIQFTDDLSTSSSGWKIGVTARGMTLSKDGQILQVTLDNGSLSTLFGFERKGTLIVSSGAITIGSGVLYLVTGSGPTNLNTINGGTFDGQLVILRAAASANPITVQGVTGGGNIRLNPNFTLTSGLDTLTLMFNGTHWCEISRADNG